MMKMTGITASSTSLSALSWEASLVKTVVDLQLAEVLHPIWAGGVMASYSGMA